MTGEYFHQQLNFLVLNFMDTWRNEKYTQDAGRVEWVNFLSEILMSSQFINFFRK